MANHSCLNVTTDDQKVSSPMPVIGLYIAATSLVCFLFMVCDVVHGLRHRKPWIPCRFFSLNSLTLTLLAIVTKLPVDLTTSMPSALDQLSKLSATTLICVSMGFFMPSLATQGDSEWLSNMTSLSILVLTVIVNVCIQMTTGVIFSFIEEHVIIMFFMLLMLIILWTSNLGFGIIINFFEFKEISDSLRKHRSSAGMMDRLKLIYERSYCCNPKLLFSSSPHSITVNMLSNLSALVLLEATGRSLFFKGVKFHCGNSDYKWSMWMVAMAQILTILLGGIVMGYRWYTSIRNFQIQNYPIIICSTAKNVRQEYLLWSNFKRVHMLSFFEFSGLGFANVFLNMVKKMAIVMQNVIEIMTQLVTFLSMKLRIYLACTVKLIKNCFCKQKNGEERKKSDYDDWIKEKSREDMKRRIEKYMSDSSKHLFQLLPNASQELPILLPKEKISSLFIVILVRMAKVILPDSLSAPLIDALVETFEIICFVVDKGADNESIFIKLNSIYAKDMWVNKDNKNHWFDKKFIKHLVKNYYSTMEERSIHDLDLALGIIGGLSRFSPYSDWQELAKEFCPELIPVWDPVFYFFELITNRNRQQPYTSISDLYDHLKQLFVDMLNFYLSQLPLAIFKYADESSNIEQSEERARLGIKFICKVKPLVKKVNWSFPDGVGITSLIGDDDVLSSSATTTHHIQPQPTGGGEIQEYV